MKAVHCASCFALVMGLFGCSGAAALDPMSDATPDATSDATPDPTDATPDACAPSGCTGSCLSGRHNVSTVVNGCEVTECCVLDDAGADATSDACALPIVCTAACVLGRHNVSTVVNGCEVTECCALDDAGTDSATPPICGATDDAGFEQNGTCSRGEVCCPGGAVHTFYCNATDAGCPPVP